MALLLCAIATALFVLAPDGALAQSTTAHVSLASDHATTDSGGVVDGFAVREGEHLVINFSIQEGRSAASGSFKYQLIEHPGTPTAKATAGADFQVQSGTITLQGDSASDDQPVETITIPIPWEWQGAGVSEVKEDFALELSDPTGQLEFPGGGTGKRHYNIAIEDRKPPVTVNANASSPVNDDTGREDWASGATEAARDEGRIAFLIKPPSHLSTSTANLTVDYKVTPVTAETGDYMVKDLSGNDLGAQGTFTIPLLTSSDLLGKYFVIEPVNDTVAEGPETVMVTFSNPSYGSPSFGPVEFPDLDGDGEADQTIEALGTILTDPADAVDLTITDATVTEGGVARMTLTLSRALAEDESARIGVEFNSRGSCQGGQAKAVAGVDYRGASRSAINFGPGDRVKHFEVQTIEDVLDEDDECLVVAYTNPQRIDVQLQTGQVEQTIGGRTEYWTKVVIEDDDDMPRFSFDSPAVAEHFAARGVPLRFIARLSQPSGREVRIRYAPTVAFIGLGQPATPGEDFVAPSSGTLVFPPGEVERSVEVTLLDDYDEEPVEYVGMLFNRPVNACFSAVRGRCGAGSIAPHVAIFDDDNNLDVAITADDDTVVEGENAVLRVTLDQTTNYDVEIKLIIDLQTGGSGAATVGDDYGDSGDGLTGYRITVPKGETEATHVIPVHSDGVSGEGVETITLSLEAIDLDGGSVTDDDVLLPLFGSGGAAALIASTSVPELKILDGPALSVTAVQDEITEGQPVRLQAILSEPASGDVTFNWKTQDGGLATDRHHTAVAGKDYLARASHQVTIPAGETSVDLPTVQTSQDSVDEWGQQFSVVLDSIAGAVANDVHQAITIRDDDSRPWLSIHDPPAVNEGEVVTFGVTLSAASEKPVSFQWLTEQDTATTAAYIRDYEGVERRRTVTFAPGQQTKTVAVRTVDDNRPEVTEQFQVQLVHAPEAKFRDPTATGTILDNDRIQISIADAPAVEEGSGQQAEFTVTMTPPQTSAVTIQWKTEDGLSGGQHAATGGADYTAQGAGSLTFAAGETEKTIAVPVLNDSNVENTEEFRVVISGDTSRIFFLRDTGYAAIEDDEARDFFLVTPLPEFIVEGDAGDDSVYTVTYEIERDKATERLNPILLACRLDGLSERGGRELPPGALFTEASQYDFSFRFGGVSSWSNWPCSLFGQGEVNPPRYSLGDDQTRGEIEVRVRGDSVPEGNEVLSVLLFVLVGDTYLRAPEKQWGLGIDTIIVDDDRPQASVSGVTVKENAGKATVTVSLSQASTQSLSVSVATRDGTAIGGRDYAAASQLVTFAPGETSQRVDFPIIDDGRVEPLDETFFVFLEGASQGLNIHPHDGEATVTIQDTSQPELTVPDRVVDEGDTATVLFNLSDPKPQNSPRARLYWNPVEGSLELPAKPVHDYESITGSRLIAFEPGDYSQTRVLVTKEDDLIETDEDIAIDITLLPNSEVTYNDRPQDLIDYFRRARITIRDDDEGSLSVSGYAGGVIRAGQEWTSPLPVASGDAHRPHHLDRGGPRRRRLHHRRQYRRADPPAPGFRQPGGRQHGQHLPGYRAGHRRGRQHRRPECAGVHKRPGAGDFPRPR